MSLDLFIDILPSIMKTKKVLPDDEIEEFYRPFIVNRALSYHLDCILFANEMNMSAHLPNWVQYQWLLSSVRGYNRPYKPWAKKYKSHDLEAVATYYGFSYRKAEEALSILSADQIEHIKRQLYGMTQEE